MKFFIYDNGSGELLLNDESILLVSEFSKLMQITRNKNSIDKTGKKRLKAFREFQFIFLFYDWESPYFQYAEQDRYEDSILDAKLTEKEMQDPDFKNACRKYDRIQNASKIGKLLKASYSTVDKITQYLETIDLNERDPVNGKPIFKTKDVIVEISSASKLIDAIKTLETSFKKELEPEGALRGDKVPGLFD